jgi:hypothetical protein
MAGEQPKSASFRLFAHNSSADDIVSSEERHYDSLMGEPSPPPPAMLLLAAFSRHGAALDWARRQAVEAWGPIALESPRFDFLETHYYDATMGPGLKKVFYAFERPFDSAELVEIKLATNRWEEEYAAAGGHAESRPLNLDPGYLALGKLVLASTKDFAHRIYLSRGIFAEVTLKYRHHQWRHHEYTFPDYRRVDYQEFFSQCREILKTKWKGGSGMAEGR